MTPTVSYKRYDVIGVICIANPPVNALGQTVRAGLQEALAQGLEDTEAEALVLLGDGRTFIAGADIREFGKPPQPPQLGEVIKLLDNSPKPIVAALHGHALGGGLEVALGCQARVAMPSTRLGLPEVTLGLLPGAGGTQRLPRLTGLDAALELITNGRFVEADQAKQLGIVDVVSDAPDVLTAGLALAHELLAGERQPRHTGALPAPASDPATLARHRARLEDEVPYLFSPFRCLDAVAASTEGSLDEGLARERELFQECMASPQRAGLIHVFFASRGPGKLPGIKADRDITHLALLGEHPLFATLHRHAERAGLHLSDRLTADSQVCLVGNRAELSPDALTEADCPVVEVAPHATSTPLEGVAFRLLPAPAGRLHELLAVEEAPELHQALAEALGRLRVPLVVSRYDGLMPALQQAIEASVSEADSKRLALQGWRLDWISNAINESPSITDHAERIDQALREASRSLIRKESCYRPEDIDVIAVDGLGYPRHLGGPQLRNTTSP